MTRGELLDRVTDLLGDKSAATRADVSQHCSIWIPVITTRRTLCSISSAGRLVLVKTLRVSLCKTGSEFSGDRKSIDL